MREPWTCKGRACPLAVRYSLIRTCRKSLTHEPVKKIRRGTDVGKRPLRPRNFRSLISFRRLPIRLQLVCHPCAAEPRHSSLFRARLPPEAARVARVPTPRRPRCTRRGPQPGWAGCPTEDLGLPSTLDFGRAGPARPGRDSESIEASRRRLPEPRVRTPSGSEAHPPEQAAAD